MNDAMFDLFAYGVRRCRQDTMLMFPKDQARH